MHLPMDLILPSCSVLPLSDGLVTVKAFYLPFAFAAISILLGDSCIPDIEGIVVGHLYYFFKELYPR